MIDKKDIIQVAISVKPHLSKIMNEEDAREIESDLENLLARVASEDDVEDLILARLSDNEEIHKWLQNTFHGLSNDRESFSKGNHESSNSPDGFVGMAGEPRPVNAPKYVCSYFGCGFEFYLNKAGMPVPDCLVHKVPLIRVDE